VKNYNLVSGVSHLYIFYPYYLRILCLDHKLHFVYIFFSVLMDRGEKVLIKREQREKYLVGHILTKKKVSLGFNEFFLKKIVEFHRGGLELSSY